VTTTREAIAAAAETVTGVSCSAYRRQSLKPRDGFVAFAKRTPDDAIGFTDTWQVWIALAQDVATAEKWIEDHVDQLAAALSTEMTVTSITPTEFTIPGASPVNGVVVEGDREA
jgi:hypothetical protein